MKTLDESGQAEEKLYIKESFINRVLKNITEYRFLYILLIISFFLRLVFSLDNNKILFIDISSYDIYAQNILNFGHMYNSPYQAPGYPYFLAAIYAVFGRNLIVVYIVQAILGTFNTLLIYLIAKLTYDVKIAKMSAVFSLFYWPLMLYTGILLSETVFIFLLLAGIYFLLLAMDSNKIRYFILCGLAFSLGSLTRSILLLAVFIVPCIYFVTNIKSLRDRFGILLKNSVLFVLVFMLVLTPWIIRNYIKYHSFVPVDALGGTNLYMGNNPRANGGYVDLDDDPVWNVEGNLVEIDNYLKVKAIEYIVNNFKTFFLLSIKRFWLFISMDFKEFDWVLIDYMRENILFKYSMNAWLTLINFTDRLFIILGALGMVKMFWNRNEKITLGVILYFILLTSVFYVQFRYRLPVMPFLSMFAAVGFNSVIKLVTVKDKEAGLSAK